MTRLYWVPLSRSAAGLAQSVERFTAEREVVHGFDSPGWTNTHGLKVTEK